MGVNKKGDTNINVATMKVDVKAEVNADPARIAIGFELRMIDEIGANPGSEFLGLDGALVSLPEVRGAAPEGKRRARQRQRFQKMYACVFEQSQFHGGIPQRCGMHCFYPKGVASQSPG